ncbi:MAG: hypothetical protein H7X88_01890, partial [Gloeobacteraceae cyanobacterium ES-bin-316]|nr:hypothetical protein [Ferruginibacter sp.]
VFFSTLCSYNFYWFLSKYSFNKPASFSVFFKKNISYFLLFTAAGLAMLICLFFLPGIRQHVAVAVFLTLVYSLPLWPFAWAVRLRKAGILKTILLPFTWAYVTVLLPAASMLTTVPNTVISLFIARFCFVGLLCIIFDRRDISLDKLHALRTLATDVSRRTLQNIILLAFGVYLVAGLWVRFQLQNNAQFIAFIITGFVVAYVYRLSLKKQGYLFYYFIVDGLMLFSASATFVATFF